MASRKLRSFLQKLADPAAGVARYSKSMAYYCQTIQAEYVFIAIKVLYRWFWVVENVHQWVRWHGQNFIKSSFYFFCPCLSQSALCVISHAGGKKQARVWNWTTDKINTKYFLLRSSRCPCMFTSTEWGKVVANFEWGDDCHWMGRRR